MVDYDEYMAANEGSPFYWVLARDESGELQMLGDVTLLNDGGGIVNNDWEGIGLRFFDSHADALRYVRTRMCDDPILYDPDTGYAVNVTVS